MRQSIARIKASPFIPHKDAVRGFVFDVATGKLNEVPLAGHRVRSGAVTGWHCPCLVQPVTSAGRNVIPADRGLTSLWPWPGE